ncbi:hypothetical protein CW304_18985 [Bacillus sp. UFRGS-B20]|nr:hypothetical protein CW304_18985 [Bacillus sp. UFRGS-B20]
MSYSLLSVEVSLFQFVLFHFAGYFQFCAISIQGLCVFCFDSFALLLLFEVYLHVIVFGSNLFRNYEIEPFFSFSVSSPSYGLHGLHIYA